MPMIRCFARGDLWRHRRRAGRLVVIVVGGLAAGCTVTHPKLLSGDADKAAVMYAGDLAAATRIAQRHCGEYDRAAQYHLTDDDVAYFDCLPRPPIPRAPIPGAVTPR